MKNFFTSFWNRTFPPSRQSLKETDRRNAQLVADQTKELSTKINSLNFTLSDQLLLTYEKQTSIELKQAVTEGRILTLEHKAADIQNNLNALHAKLEDIKAATTIATAPFLLRKDFEPTYLPDKETYPLFNCSVVFHENKLVYIARCTNYTAYRDGHWSYRDPPHNTYNVMYEKVESGWIRQAVDDSLLRERFVDQLFAGMEDTRLFVWRGQLMGACALVFVSDASGAFCGVTQAIVQFQGATIVDVWPLASPLNRPWEKNWIPLVKDDRLYLVYSFLPTVVFEFVAGRMVLVKGELDQYLDFTRRGGTQMIPYKENYLGLVHSAPIHVGARMHYLHSFLIMTQEFDVAQISSEFFIQRRGIEFASGLADDGDGLILSYGLTERRAAYCRVSYTEVSRWIA